MVLGNRTLRLQAYSGAAPTPPLQSARVHWREVRAGVQQVVAVCSSERSTAVLYLRRVLSVALIVTPVLLGITSTQAKTGEENSAVSLLLQAQQQYDNQEYQAARAALWEAYGIKDQLSQSQQDILQQRLGEVDQALHQETMGKALYSMANGARKAKNWSLAKDGYSKAARCPFLPADVRSDAQDKLALVEMKLAAEMVASTPAAEPAKSEAPRDVVVLAAAPAETATPTEASAPAEEAAPAAVPVAAEETNADTATPAPAAVATETPKTPEAAPAVAETPTPEEKPEPVAQNSSAPASSSQITPDQAHDIKVDMLIAQGKDAVNKNQPDKAVRYFQRALEMDPENEVIRRQLDYARRQTAQPAETGILSKYVQQQRIAKQIAETDIAGALRRSMELMAKPAQKEDFDAAAQAAQVAKSILQNNKRLFTTTQYRERLGKIENQIKWVGDKREAWERSQVAQTVRKINEAEKQRESDARMRKEKKIAELTMRAHALRQERKYMAALRIMEQIVEIDPKNTWALDNIYMLRQFITLEAQQQMANADKVERAKLTADMRATEIPWYDKIRYPRDWKELTARRERYSASSSTESEENRVTLNKLKKRIPKIELTDVRFFDVIGYLREVSGANFHVSWGSLEVDDPEIKDKQIQVDLSDVSVERALTIVLDSAGGGIMKLGYVVEDGVITIDTQENINSLTYPQVYDIRDLLARVPNFTGPRVSLDSIGSMELGNSDSQYGGGSSSSSGGDSLFDDSDSGSDDDEEDEDLNMTRSEMVTELKNLIVTTVDRESWYPNGNGQINELSGNLVITQTSQNHREVQKLISRLREMRTIQVSIEARFITVNTGFLSQIGVDLDFYFNIGSEIGGGGTTTDPFTGATVPVRGPSTWNQNGNNADASLRKVSPFGATQNSTTFANVFNQSTNVPGGIGSMVSAPAMSVAGTFLDDLQVDFLIQATQAHSSTRTLTAPRVTLFNGQRAYVNVATQQAFISGVEPFVSENTSALRPIIAYAPTGQMLDVDATVSHDRRYVTMTLRPQVTSLNGMGNTTIASGGNVVTIGLPNMTMQMIETTVSVPDGGTLLIGGQKLSGEVEKEMGVPVVSKLPVINRAFTNKGKLRDEQTLLILVKPTIIIQAEAERDENIHTEEPAFAPGLSTTF